MDTRLPGLSGYQLCEVLRRDSSTQGVPILVVTGEADPAAVERAHKAGANVVLTKPALLETMLAAIRQLLKTRGVRVALTEDERQLPAGAITRHSMSRGHHRGDTLAPPLGPPTLVCPQCDEPLRYQRSHVGGVSARYPEQWDDYECPNACGTFQYRQRTRKLRKL
jgi:hypothetical protein